MTAVYANLFRYETDVHQVRLIFFDQRKGYENTCGFECAPQAEKVSEVVMTRQSFDAFREIMNNQIAPGLPPIAIPGQPYPPQFASEHGVHSIPPIPPMTRDQLVEWARSFGVLIETE